MLNRTKLETNLYCIVKDFFFVSGRKGRLRPLAFILRMSLGILRLSPEWTVQLGCLSCKAGTGYAPPVHGMWLKFYGSLLGIIYTSCYNIAALGSMSSLCTLLYISTSVPLTTKDVEMYFLSFPLGQGNSHPSPLPTTGRNSF